MVELGDELQTVRWEWVVVERIELMEGRLRGEFVFGEMPSGSLTKTIL